MRQRERKQIDNCLTIRKKRLAEGVGLFFSKVVAAVHWMSGCISAFLMLKIVKIDEEMLILQRYAKK